MNLMRARFARAACGISSRLASPRLTFRNRYFGAASAPGLNDLWCSGFFARPSRAEQPQQQTGCASHSASIVALARLFSHAFRIASLRGVAGRFSFSDCWVVVVIPSIKIFGNSPAQDTYMSGIGTQIAGPFLLCRSGGSAFAAEYFKRALTPPGRSGSRRRRAPLPFGEAPSVIAEPASPDLRAGCPGDER